MLTLADIRQKESYDCGLAAVRCIVAYFGCRYANLAERLATNGMDGTDPRSIEGFLRQEGFMVQSGSMTIDDLKHHIKLGRPVLVLVSWKGGHYIVVSGVSRGYVYYQDPNEGPGRAKIAEFENDWEVFDRFGTNYEHFGIAVWA
jgi:ABC-type bacteriocin/lantibiotic exporter with double-glycine peptidase domain